MEEENNVSPAEHSLFNVSLKYKGGFHAEHNSIDLYDLSVALYGFQRFLSISTHFLASGEIVTRSPDINDVKILAYPASSGSFEMLAYVGLVGTAVYKIFTAPSNTPLGHLAWSLYEFVMFKATGRMARAGESIFLDYAKDKEVAQSKGESLAQKLESAVIAMHRPIVTQSATHLEIVPDITRQYPDIYPIILDSQTLDTTNKLSILDQTKLIGRVAAYSANTRSGMIYTGEERRAIPFQIERTSIVDTSIISRSLMLYDKCMQNHKSKSKEGFFTFLAQAVVNQAGMTKKYYITHVYKDTLIEDEDSV